MEELSPDLLNHGDVWRALRELLQRGLKNRQGERMKGLKELMEQLRQQRQRRMEQYNLDSVMNDLKERVQKILDTERQGIQRRLDQARQQAEEAEGPERKQMEQLLKMMEQRAKRNLDKLDRLPPSVSGAVKGLMDYDFMDPDAQAQFQELLNMLKGRMADNFVQGLKDRLQNMTPQDMAALREMLRQLNQMLKDQMSGRQPDFQGFMQQFGPMFGPNPPQNLEELLEQMARQLAQAQSLLDSMSPEARRDLMDLLNSVLDEQTQRELAELSYLLSQMMPMEDMRRQYPFIGDESLTLDQAMDVMGQLQGLDELEQNLKQALESGNLDQVDPNRLQELLGDDARRMWEDLKRLRELLEEAGYIKGQDKLELTPRGIRKIAQKSLKELFFQLKKDRAGNHDLYTRGAGGDTLEETKLYEFGDPFQVHLNRTVMNAIFDRGPQVPVKLKPKDFEIYQNEETTRAATVLLLDQSRSMGLFGSFQAAKKVAMALYGLIHTQFSRDTLHVIGFSDYAREIKEDDLPKVSWNPWVSGTNIHHALMLSREILSKQKGGTRQIILITDGEPTAHLVGGRAYFSYPPSYETLVETLKEVRRCTQERIVINTFMLESSYHLLDFVEKLTRINRGRAFYTTPDKLGQYVLVDYVNNRRKRVT